MESVIARLVQDFEHGVITRRQLIQSLALTVTAATGATASPLTAVAAARGNDDETNGFTAIAVNHISYQVKDYTKTRDFYSSLLGMTVKQDNGRQCYLTFGDYGTWLLPRNARDSSQAPRVDHIAYGLPRSGD